MTPRRRTIALGVLGVSWCGLGVAGVGDAMQPGNYGFWCPELATPVWLDLQTWGGIAAMVGSAVLLVLVFRSRRFLWVWALTAVALALVIVFATPVQAGCG